MATMAWQAAGVAYAGATHRHDARPCAGAVAARRIEGGCVIAVADGGGSPRGPAGARLAVEAAGDVLAACGHVLAREPARPGAVLAPATLARLSRGILEAWHDAVGDDAARASHAAALAAVLVAGDWCVGWQIGAGDVIAVGERARFVLPDGDARACLGGWGAAERARIAGWSLRGDPTRLFLVSSGGARGGRDDAAALRIAGWYLARLDEEGLAPVVDGVGDDLARASRLAGGADATLAFAHRPASRTARLDSDPGRGASIRASSCHVSGGWDERSRSVGARAGARRL